MFNEYVILHTPPTIPEPQADKNAFSLEKMTQTGDGIWQVSGYYVFQELFFSIAQQHFYFAFN